MMKRRLPPELVITMASAHSNPTSGNEYKVVNWLRAAAILAQIDPLAQGFLFTNFQTRLRLPKVGQIGSVHPLAGSTSLAQSLSHTNVLAVVSGRFGFNPADTANYRTS